MTASPSPSPPPEDDMMTESFPAQYAAEELDRKATVECRAWDKLHLALQDAGIFGIPDNWRIEVRERRSGVSKGDFDFYYFDRDNNKKFRSQREAVSAILANQELLCSARSQDMFPGSLCPIIKQQEAEEQATGPLHPGPAQLAWLAPDQPPIHRSIKIKFKIRDPLGAAAAGARDEQQQLSHMAAGPRALNQSPTAAAENLQLVPPVAALALEQPPISAAAGPPQQVPPFPAPALQPEPREAAPALQHPPVAAPALQQLPPPAPMVLQNHSGTKLRLVVAPRKAAKGAALQNSVMKAKDRGGHAPAPLSAAAPRPQRIVLKKSKQRGSKVLPQAKQRAGLGCIDAAALELLVAAALGQQDGNRKGGPAAEEDLGYGSDPGSGSATDVAAPDRVAPGLQLSREPFSPAVPLPARSNPGPEANRGARASYRKRFRGQMATGAGPSGQHGALPSGLPGACNGSRQACQARHGPGLGAGSGVSAEACQQAVQLLQAALPGLLGAVQVVGALKAQGIGGAPFDGLAAAVEKVQTACRQLQG